MSKKLLTLCFLLKDEHILLGMKKRGVGQGHWNGFGGKVEAGETIEEAAKREVQEEVGMTVHDLQKVGVLDFTLPGEEKVWQVHIFKTTKYTGEPTETEEMKPQWFSTSEIPYDHMWADDPYWIPLMLDGKLFTGEFIFETLDKIGTYEVRVAEAV